MKRGQQRATMMKERITLNPRMEEDDRRECEIALQDKEKYDLLERAWFACLNSGTALRDRACDSKHFRKFAIACKYGNNERNLSTALRTFDAHMDDTETIDFHGFVKCLFHLGMERGNTTDYQLALRNMIIDFVSPWYEEFKKQNCCDGEGEDAYYLDIPEVDRILYVYDAVLDRLFTRYRDVDQHGNRELTLDQLKILDNFAELEEMKEFMKDYGYFPKHLSYVEISKCCQFACFGKVVVDPTRQGAGRHSQIEKTRSPEVKIDIVTSPAETPEEKSINPLYIPALPQEFLHDEVLLDKPRFMSAFLRLAQACYHRPEYLTTLPSVASRIEEMLTQIAPTYEKMFGRTVDQDCDWTEKGVPILANTSPSAAVAPSVGPMEGGFEVSVSGTNFCEKRGVFVRFGEGEKAIVVRSSQIQKKKVICVAPPMEPTDVVVKARFLHGEYEVQLSRIAKIPVECSNNRWQYSITDPQQIVTFQYDLPQYTISEEISAKLMTFFSAVCGFDDRYNTKYLSRDGWKKIKEKCQLIETPSKPEADVDGFFLELSEFHEGGRELTVDFKSYLRALSRTLFEMMGERWVEGLLRVADAEMTFQKRNVEMCSVPEENEITLARQAIALVEHRSCVELDVYLGPVLCGVLKSVPGSITSICTGKKVIHRKAHLFLQYEHHELNTEKTVLHHINVCKSMIHLMQRLRHDGFDFAAHHSNPSSRKPPGRCWSIVNSSGGTIGAVWDYAGNYSNLQWQPVAQDMFKSCVTMCAYVDEAELDFVICYILFMKADNIASLRAAMASRGYKLLTKLYKLP